MVTELDKQTALVLIDLQNGIVNRELATPVNKVIENAVKLIHAFHTANLPVVFVNVKPVGAKWMQSRKDAKQPQGNTPPPEEAFELIESLPVYETDIRITKHTWNAFFETALHDELQKKGVTGIVIGGVATSIGVEGTARAASERGYNITFAKDAMTDMILEAHQNSLTHIFPRMGEVDDTDQIIGFLR